MERDERDNRNAVMAAWVLRLVDTHDDPIVTVGLGPELRSVLTQMSDGATWEAITKRLGGERWMMASSIGTAAAWAVTQQYRVPSLVVPMLSEFRDWAFGVAACLRWELMGIGEEDAAFLADLGSPFKEQSER